MVDIYWKQALEAAIAQSHSLASKDLQLSIQPLHATDIERIHEVEKTAYAYPWSRKHFEDSVAAGHAVVALVATFAQGRAELPDAAWVHAPLLSNGAYVLAYCVAMMGVQEAHLLNITTPPAHRRRGWARLLLETLAHWSHHKGAQQLWLEVRRSNAAAQALYAAMGFEPMGVRKGYYPDAAGQREDAIVMRRALLH